MGNRVAGLSGNGQTRKRYGRPRRLTLAKVLQAEGLSAQEQLVICQRVRGHSFAEIAAELVGPCGGTCSRQRLQQVEARAVRKLGLNGSIESLVHAAEREERALVLIERGRRVQAGELSACREERRVRQFAEPWEREHEARVKAFLLEAQW